MAVDARQRLAELLVAARREGQQVRNLDPKLVPATHAEAYTVNALEQTPITRDHSLLLRSS